MPRKSGRKKRVVGEVGIKFYELAGFAFQTFKLPGLEKRREKLVRRSYSNARKIARRIGVKPKEYRMLGNGHIEVIR
jgi:hypothetical protein